MEAIASEVPGLTVRLGRCRQASAKQSRWPDHGKHAYRIVHVESDRVLPVPFARQQDAQAAMRAIGPLADWTRPHSELIKTIDLELVRRTMLEALAW